MNPTNAQIQAELDALPDSAFIDGIDQVVGAGNTFRRGDKILTVVGFAERNVWDDASDQWVVRRAAGCRPATRQEATEAGYAEETATIVEPAAPAAKAAPAKRYAIRADNGNGYFAIVGKRQGSAATRSIEKATVFGSIAEAKEAMATVAEAAPGYFGEKQQAVVVMIP